MMFHVVVVLLLFSDLFHDNCDAFITTSLLHPTQASRRRVCVFEVGVDKRRCPPIFRLLKLTVTTEGGATTAILPGSTSSRLKRTTDFLNWATANDIKYVSSC